ncbi:MAG: hypothetical protein J3K34DRAFT_408287 [Monoraphidium minutum]|nr:MAG: hypothetical protein J3K34DRAFT_408287 [Monoraphidium minutum]
MLSLKAASGAMAVRPTRAAKPTHPAATKPVVRAARAAAPAARGATVAKALPIDSLPMEVAMVSGEAGFIAGVAAVMCAITLVGLAIGFVLLRVESLAEDGTL